MGAAQGEQCPMTDHYLRGRTMAKGRQFNGSYRGQYLDQIGFPMGGIGAGMICLSGTGSLTHFSVRNKPDVFNEPYTFAAVCVRGAENVARVLEGPVPRIKAFGYGGAGNGSGSRPYGFPRFADAVFKARFPFATVTLTDPSLPVKVEVTGWSPFIPNNADDSSLPVAGLEYRFVNTSGAAVEAVFSFNTKNMMAVGGEGASVTAVERGFVLRQAANKDRSFDQGCLCAQADAAETAVNCAWFRGGWFDAQTMAWKDVERGEAISRPPVTEGAASPGASLYVPMILQPGEERTVRVRLSWYVPESDIRTGDPKGEAVCAAGCGCGKGPGGDRLTTYSPWYATAFPGIEAVAAYWDTHYDRLRRQSRKFSRCFYDSTLPPEVIEAVAANLTILKSPTVLRQGDGRLWAWEGCSDQTGCCAGTCTHVWNYAQALPHLFPALERTLRETEFQVSQDDAGHQTFRSALPIRTPPHDFHAAADGQLGGIMKAHREWRVSGDTEWLRGLWPGVRRSMDYCIATWDPDHKGVLREPHHNTYDIEFWGPDGMCTSFYLGALRAAVAMGIALGEDVALYGELLKRGRDAMETDLFDGEYFIQKVEWTGLRAGDPTTFKTMRGGYSTEAMAILEREGPKYQYGRGCLADGVLGAWIAAVCGVPEFLSRDLVRSHLKAVHKYNLKKDLSAHANPQRPSYAFGKDGGLLLCTWPKGGKLSLPFPYSDEVWTGYEYQVASHLMLSGCAEEAVEIVRVARLRYDGRYRNPFNEYECGHWYARAMSSYGMLQGLSGARYDAIEKVLYLAPSIQGDFRCFLCTATGYGVVGVKDGKPFLEVKDGKIDAARIEYKPCNA